MTWDGGFATAEYRLHVRDRSGAPVPNTELTVRDAHGDVAYDFPIDDFNRARTLRSDATGTLVFHHVSGGLEFGGSCLVPFCSPSNPKFVLDLSTAGRRRARVNFDDFANMTPQKTSEGQATLSLTISRAWIALQRTDSSRAFEVRAKLFEAMRTQDDHAQLELMTVVVSTPAVERDVVIDD